MTLAQVVQEAQQLSPDERLILAQLMLDSLEDTTDNLPPSNLSILDMAGFLKPTGPMPSDQDIDNIIVEYLEEKYL